MELYPVFPVVSIIVWWSQKWNVSVDFFGIPMSHFMKIHSAVFWSLLQAKLYTLAKPSLSILAFQGLVYLLPDH